MAMLNPTIKSGNDIVPIGYKRTEVGIIPEDWEISTVGNEFTIQLGKMLDGDKNTGIPKSYIGNRAVQWGKIDINGVGTMLMSPTDIKKFRLFQGDLLVCEGGEIGRSAIWNNEILECYYQKALHRLRPTNGYNTHFMMYLLNLWVLNDYLSYAVTQTSIAHLPKDKFEVICIPNPPYKEQRAIAEALSDTDALITALDGLIAKKRAIKQATMQQLLTGKTRLPGFEGEWISVQLGEVARIKTGGRNNQDKVEDGQYPFFVRSATVETINSYSYEGEAILIPGEGNIGNIFHYINGKFDVHQRVYQISHFSEMMHGKFLFYILSQYFGQHAMQNTVKATVDSLRLPTFMTFTFVVPEDINEQQSIATVLSDMDAELDALEQRRAKTIQIKQGMMQQLLTGRIRLRAPLAEEDA